MRITFILGAGASQHYGYPLGYDLKNKILGQLGPNGGAIYRELVAAGNEPEEILEFQKSLFRADYETIDQFIGAHGRNPHIQRLCKQSIVLSIAGCENETSLFNAGWHWYKRLIDFFRQRPEVLTSDSFSFVTFNYDRSLEHYLYETVNRGGGNFSQNHLKEFFQDNFLHVHGSIGPLLWQATDGQVRTRDYGASIQAEDIRLLANNIITPDEDSAVTDHWKNRLRSSDVILIVGFGYHPKNLSKIGFDDFATHAQSSRSRILATVHRLHEDRVKYLGGFPAVTRIDLDSNNFVSQFLDYYDRLDVWLEGWMKRQ